MQVPVLDPATAASPRVVTIRLLAGCGLVVLGLIGVLVLIGVHDAFTPGPGLLGEQAPLVVPVFGMPLVLAGAVSAGLAWPLRRHLRRTATTVVVGAASGAALLAVPVAILLTAVLGAGGSVNLLDAVALSSTAPSPPDARPVYTSTPEGEQLHLAVDTPRAHTGTAPVMVLVHGGGWIGGSELGRLADMRRLADAGWLVISVHYTLATPGRPTWDVAGPQVACALTRITAQAAAWGGDPGRVVLVGDSAGGQLAVSVGYHAASGTQPSSCGGQVPVPRAIVAEYPAVDLAEGYEHGARSPIPALDARFLAAAYTGGTPTEVPERYRAISGTDAITRAAPPTLVIGPTEDSLVPPAGVDRFVAAARQGGVDMTLVRIPFSDHAFDTFATGSLGHQAGISIIQSWAGEQVGAR